MKIEFLILILIFNFKCFSQKISCEDFKVGKFCQADETDFYCDVIRDKKTQIEIFTTELDFGKKMYYTINWLSECTYVLKFDFTKMDWDIDQQETNDHGGIFCEMGKIENNCYYLTVTWPYLEEKPMKAIRKICICENL